MAAKCLFEFKEFGGINGIDLPSIRDSLHDIPYPEKQAVLSYMQKGRKTVCTFGKAIDVFTGEAISGERCIMTDGEYSWNNDLIYYVDRYNLSLDESFMAKAVAKEGVLDGEG